MRGTGFFARSVVVTMGVLLLFSCPHPLKNQLDPEAENYLGFDSPDDDGDGVGQYFDVDEIILVSPEEGAELESVTPTLTVYGFDPDTVTAYHLQISTSKESFADNLVLDKSDYTTNACVVPAGKLIWPVTYYWRAKAYDGEKWSGSWSEARSFTVPADTITNPVPANDGTTIDTTPTLNWDDITGAAGYHIQVNTAEDFGGTSIADNDTLTASEYSVTTVLSDNSTYYWRVKAKNADGVWGDWGSTWSFTVMKNYDVGDTGPAGGLVFYDKGSYSDGWRYLEAAPQSTEWTSIAWSDYGTDIPGAEGTAVGTGEQNTADIVSHLGAGSTYAGQLCEGLECGDYDDWFLPSKDELNLMYKNLHQQALGGFSDKWYWSSSEYGSDRAWEQYFSDGYQRDDDKDDTFLWLPSDNKTNGRVRAVRAF